MLTRGGNAQCFQDLLHYTSHSLCLSGINCWTWDKTKFSVSFLFVAILSRLEWELLTFLGVYDPIYEFYCNFLKRRGGIGQRSAEVGQGWGLRNKCLAARLSSLGFLGSYWIFRFSSSLLPWDSSSSKSIVFLSGPPCLFLLLKDAWRGVSSQSVQVLLVF